MAPQVRNGGSATPDRRLRRTGIMISWYRTHDFRFAGTALSAHWNIQSIMKTQTIYASILPYKETKS